MVPHRYQKREAREAEIRIGQECSLIIGGLLRRVASKKRSQNVPRRASLEPSRSRDRAFSSSSRKSFCKSLSAVLKISTAWSCAMSSTTAASPRLSSSSSFLAPSQSPNHERTAQTSFNVRNSANQPLATLRNSATALENHSLSRPASCTEDRDDVAEAESTKGLYDRMLDGSRRK